MPHQKKRRKRKGSNPAAIKKEEPKREATQQPSKKRKTREATPCSPCSPFLDERTQVDHQLALPDLLARASCSNSEVLWLDEIHPAPPKKKRTDDSPANTNEPWFPMVPQRRRISSIHSVELCVLPIPGVSLLGSICFSPLEQNEKIYVHW